MIIAIVAIIVIVLLIVVLGKKKQGVQQGQARGGATGLPIGVKDPVKAQELIAQEQEIKAEINQLMRNMTTWLGSGSTNMAKGIQTQIDYKKEELERVRQELKTV